MKYRWTVLGILVIWATPNMPEQTSFRKCSDAREIPAS